MDNLSLPIHTVRFIIGASGKEHLFFCGMHGASDRSERSMHLNATTAKSSKV